MQEEEEQPPPPTKEEVAQKKKVKQALKVLEKDTTVLNLLKYQRASSADPSSTASLLGGSLSPGLAQVHLEV